MNTNETTFETVMSDEEAEPQENSKRFTPVTQFQTANKHTNRFLEDMEMLPSSALNTGEKTAGLQHSNTLNIDRKLNSISLGSDSSYNSRSFSETSSDSSAIASTAHNSQSSNLIGKSIFSKSEDTPMKNFFANPKEEVVPSDEDIEDESDSSIDEDTRIKLQCLPYKTIYDAYYAIELDSNIKEIDWVETSYNLKIQDEPENKVFYDRALLTLGLGLKSLPLLNTVLTNNKLMMEYYSGPDFSYEDAVRCLKLDEDNEYSFTEMDVINNFVVICLKNEKEFNETTILQDEVFDNFLYYFIALKFIGDKLKSDIIARFLKTGFIDDRLLKNGNWPVGLFNMGNTCYLNSLLQYYFAICPLKKYILEYSKEKTEPDSSKDVDLIRCEDFLVQIKNLYHDMITSQYKISVPSNELVYLAFAPRGGLGLVEGKVPDMDSLEMSLDLGRQQDVTECMLNFIEQIDATIVQNKDEIQTEIKDTLFNGKLGIGFKDLLDSDIQGKSNMEETFTSLLIHLHNNPKNLYEALDQFFNDDQQVMQMNEYGQVKKHITIKELPEILQIQIQRVQFDKNKLEPVKNTFQLAFPETLFLDRYVKDTVCESDLKDYQSLTQRLMFLKQKRFALLKKAKSGFNGAQPINLRSSISTTLKYLQSELYENSMQFDDEDLKRTIKSLSGMKDHIDKKIIAMDESIAQVSKSKETHFDKYRKYKYSLFAIFMHRGEANYGHYWIYIKDGLLWRKYNDEEVSAVEKPQEQIFNFDSSNQDTAYYLAYVREDKISELIQPLDRKLPPE